MVSFIGSGDGVGWGAMVTGNPIFMVQYLQEMIEIEIQSRSIYSNGVVTVF